jgi:hypothetical protein
MGTHLHSDLSRPLDAPSRSAGWGEPGARRAPGHPLLGQTEAVVAELGDTNLALVFVITIEDAEDGVYLTSAPCPEHGAHDFYAQWDGEAEVAIDGADEPLVVPLLTFVGHAEI